MILNIKFKSEGPKIANSKDYAKKISSQPKVLHNINYFFNSLKKCHIFCWKSELEHFWCATYFHARCHFMIFSKINWNIDYCTWDLSLMLLISSITKLKLYFRGSDLFSMWKSENHEISQISNLSIYIFLWVHKLLKIQSISMNLAWSVNSLFT